MNTSLEPKTGVLLVNLGTPDSTKTGDVRRYLREFLMDGRVIDIPFIPRFLLVNLIIAPFRAPKSAKEYRKVWEERGSPLKFYGEDVREALQENLGEEFIVKFAMRYQNPSLDKVMEEFRQIPLRKLIVLPMFPQYASATTGSVKDKVMKILRKWQIIPEIDFIHSFFDHPDFVEAFTQIGKNYLEQDAYDHVIFSYHGLPERQIRKGDCYGNCLKAAKENPELAAQANCCAQLTPQNKSCYRAQCFATTRLIAEKLDIKPENYTVCFQSRLGKDPWIQPYTEDVLEELAHAGKKRVLAFSPAFVTDCLETTIEVGEEYKEDFEEAGGEHWQLVESLNCHPLWIKTLRNLVMEHSAAQQHIIEGQAAKPVTE